MTVPSRWVALELALLAACSGGGSTPPTPPPVNQPPIALAQSLSTPRDTPLAVTLAGADPEGRPITFAIASPPSHGALSSSGATWALVYTPAAGYEGPDGFTFTVSDGALTSSPATVSVTVTHLNHPPQAVADAAATDFGWPVTIAVLANDTDADGDALTVTAATQAAHGAATFTAASVTYWPAAGFSGVDGFTYTVSDGHGGEASGAVTVTVRAAATLQVSPASLDFTGTVEGIAPAPRDVTVTNVGGSPLRWTARSDVPWLVLTPTAGQGALAAGSFRVTALPSRTDAWTGATTTAGAPAARYGHSATWTGRELIVWGGRLAVTGGGSYLADGAGYDPASDAWSGPIASEGAPSPRNGHAAAWTGRELIIWGGDGGAGYLGDGALYDPLFDRWRPMSSAGAPSPRETMAAAWTGTELVVWGGSAGGAPLADGARYDPSTDTWRPMSSAGAPAARTRMASSFTGAELLVWGGQTGTDGLGAMVLTQTGGRYDPASDTWLGDLPTDGAPAARAFATGVWTGGELIVWGGQVGADTFGIPWVARDGGRYRPGVGWVGGTSNQLGTVPPSRLAHAAAWTGDEMVAWGGYPAGPTGGRYVPPLWLEPGLHRATVTVSDPHASNRAVQLAVTLDLSAPPARLAGAFPLASATSAAAQVHPAALAAGAGNSLFAAGTVERVMVGGVPSGDLTFGAGQAAEVTLSATTTMEAWLSRTGADGSLGFARLITARGVGQSIPMLARGAAVTVLADGTVAVAGTFAGQTVFGPGDPNETILTPDGTGNGFLAAFDSTGRLQRVKRIGGGATTSPTSLAPLPGGGCLLAGRFSSGSAIFGPGEPNQTTLTNSALADHAFLARFGADGSLTWARSLTDGPGQLPYEARVPLAATPDGAALVAWMLYGAATVGAWGPSPVALGDSAVYRTILARVEGNGDLGWVNSTTPVGAEALASLADGSPVLTGGSAVAGFDPAGAPGWFQVIHGATSSGEALVALPDSSTFLSGHAMGWTTFWPGELAPVGGWDLFAGRVASDGALPWVRGAGGAGNDMVNGAALLTDGTVAVLGSAVGSATFGAGEPGQVTLSPPVAGAAQLVVARYRP